jgi:hypothetical protein
MESFKGSDIEVSDHSFVVNQTMLAILGSEVFTFFFTWTTAGLRQPEQFYINQRIIQGFSVTMLERDLRGRS